MRWSRPSSIQKGTAHTGLYDQLSCKILQYVCAARAGKVHVAETATYHGNAWLSSYVPCSGQVCTAWHLAAWRLVHVQQVTCHLSSSGWAASITRPCDAIIA